MERLHTIFKDLNKYSAKTHINVTVEKDEDMYLALCPALKRVYGYGSNKQEALRMLRDSVESLYEDYLSEDMSKLNEEHQKEFEFLSENLVKWGE